MTMKTVPHGTFVTGSAKGTASRLIQEFQNSPPLTGETEAYRNFRQAMERLSGDLQTIDGVHQSEKARMVIDAVAIGVDGKTVLVQSMWNTAPPMLRETIRDYFNTIGESEGEDASWAPDNQIGNYGQGLRQGMLPKNLYGFVIIGVPQGGGEPFMLWIEYLADEKVFALKPLVDYIDEDEDEPVYAEVVDVTTQEGIDFTAFINDDLRKWGGMAFVSLGDERGQHTVMNVELNPKGKIGPGQAETILTERIHDAEGLSFREVFKRSGGEDPRAKKVWEVDGVKFAADDRFRGIKSHKIWFDPTEHPGVQSETLIHPDGTKIVIALAPEPSTLTAPNHFPYRGKGYCEVVYKADVHPLWRSKKHAETAAHFGITDKKVSDRIAIEITPPKVVDGTEPFGVVQDRSRTFLYARSAGKDPMLLVDSGKPNEWGDWVADHLPSFIRDALDEARASRVSERPEDWDKVLKDIVAAVRSRHSGTMLAAKEGGGEKGDASGESMKKTADEGDPTKDPKGEGKGKADEVEDPTDAPDGEGKGGRKHVKPDPTVDPDADGDDPYSHKRVKQAVEVLIGNPSGALEGVKRRASSLPLPTWHSHEGFYASVAALDDPEENPKASDYPVYYNPTLPGEAGRTIHFNWDHKQFKDLYGYYCTEWIKGKRLTGVDPSDLPDMVRDAMELAYIEVVVGTIVATQRDVRSKGEQERLFAPDHLHTVVRGDFNVKYRVESLLGTYLDLGKRGKYTPRSGGKTEAPAA